MDSRLLELLEELAVLLELSGENPFKAQAYARAARTLREHEVDVHRAVAEGTLRELPGIGPSLEEAIREYVATGTIALYERLRRQIPQGLLELTHLPQVGPRRARQLYEQLGIASVEELEQACRQHRVAALKGFGGKTEAALLKAIERWKQTRFQLHLHTALQEAQRWRERLLALPDVTAVLPTGVLRRFAETVAEIALVVVTPHQERFQKVLRREMPEFTAESGTRYTARDQRGIRIRLELASTENAGWILLVTTGSDAFIEAVFEEFRARGFEPAAQALSHRGRAVPLRTEDEVFALLQLPVIPPELREEAELLARVRRSGLPSLVRREELQGMLHVHSTWSDGKASIRHMAHAAKELGYRYIAICDHSPSAYYAGGLDRERLVQQHREIERLNAENLGITILKGAEVDIRPDGTLDYPDEVLDQLEVVVASVHSHFRQSAQEMTARILRALEHPRVQILGHATGRLLLSREPYELDLEAVLQTALRLGKVIEFNAQPYRFDVSWEVLRRWQARGLKIAINPDAHAVAELAYTDFGVMFARKALFPPEQVINTWSLEQFREFCARKEATNT